MAAPKGRPIRMLEILTRSYPGATCALNHGNPFELLVATILSAQCTDARVNQVTPALFSRCPDAAALATIPQEELEALVRPTGFFRNKARSLRSSAEMIVRDFSGRVPDSMEGLLRLPGVARKTANVLLGTAFGKDEGIVVDTHVGRLAIRMGLSGHRDPTRVERDLMALFPADRWTEVGHLLILHGRALCKARRPACERCPVAALCPRVGVA